MHAVSSGIAHDPRTDELRAPARGGFEIHGPWRIRFQAGRGAPAEATFPELISWTDSDDGGIRHFSGIAEYAVRFTPPAELLGAGSTVELDLGQLRKLSKKELAELDELYRHTKEVRIRTRAQMILLAAEQQLTAPQIAKIVRKDDQTVRNWLKRYNAEGLNGLFDAPRPGTPVKVTGAYHDQLIQVVRRRSRSLGLPYSLWTLQRLVDHMAEETGLRVSTETVRLHLKAEDIVISRPQHKVSSADPEYMVKKDD